LNEAPRLHHAARRRAQQPASISKAARALGVPDKLLALADEVIE
jgi:hypothetical protein